MMRAVVAGVEELSERIMALVAQETGRERAVITSATELQRDLGCSPDEIRALLARLQREYRIDMTGFDFDRHFETPASLVWPIGVALVVSLPLSVLIVMLAGPSILAAGLVSPKLAASGGLFALVYAASALLIGVLTVALPMMHGSQHPKLPVTAETLIEAALLKKWPYASVKD